MTSDWYNGHYFINILIIEAEYLHSIMADAFSGVALRKLLKLHFYVAKGMVHVCAGALNDIDLLKSIEFNAENVRLPIGLFDPVAISMVLLEFRVWPYDVNINEMFAGEVYRHLELLEIRNVRRPQTKFRILAANNFTTFRRLEGLLLINCGIEVIEERTFDAIGRKLKGISLENNRIKSINIGMFRVFVETKSNFAFRIGSNKEKLMCTCHLVELDVMLQPLRHQTRLSIDCWSSGGFSPSACQIYRDINFSKISFIADNIRGFIRIIVIRMAYAGNGFVSLHTDFSSKIRVLLTSADSMRRKKCADRAMARENINCLSIDKFVGHLDLNEFAALRDSELISITAIPILHAFGARPMHMMTLRRTRIQKMPIWIDVQELVFIAMLACCFSAIAGFIGVLGWKRMIASVKINEFQLDYVNAMYYYDYGYPYQL